MTAKEDEIHAFHTSGHRAVLAITGGGSGLISDLLSVPGGSASVIEAAVPYAESSLRRFLGGSFDRACSRDTSLAMAAQAFVRASDDAGENAVGFGMTAALASDRPKRGDHRVHAAAQSLAGTWAASVTLAKGQRSRAEEENAAAAVGFAVLAAAAGMTVEPRLSDGPFQIEFQPSDTQVREVRSRQSAVAWPNATLPDFRGILSGSFNPPHHGHDRLREVAAEILGGPVIYELPLINSDKPPLDDLRLAERLQRLAGPVAVTRADTFLQKAAVFEGRTFVVGVDTAARVLDPRYYETGVESVLAEIRDRGCRFLVASRWDGRRLVRLSDCPVPRNFAGLFDEIDPADFREDVSSSAIRSAAET